MEPRREQQLIKDTMALLISPTITTPGQKWKHIFVDGLGKLSREILTILSTHLPTIKYLICKSRSIQQYPLNRDDKETSYDLRGFQCLEGFSDTKINFEEGVYDLFSSLLLQRFMGQE